MPPLILVVKFFWPAMLSKMVMPGAANRDIAFMYCAIGMAAAALTEAAMWVGLSGVGLEVKVMEVGVALGSARVNALCISRLQKTKEKKEKDKNCIRKGSSSISLSATSTYTYSTYKTKGFHQCFFSVQGLNRTGEKRVSSDIHYQATHLHSPLMEYSINETERFHYAR